MIPISDDELVLYFFGESARNEEIALALQNDPAMASRYSEIVSVLGAVEKDAAPERPTGYETQVWQRLQWKLRDAAAPEPWWRRWFAVRFLVPAGALAALVVLAFVIGRWGPGAPPNGAIASDVRERILLVDVGQHLGEAEMVLVEVLNAESDSAELESVRDRAGELLAGNRVYRQATTQSDTSPEMATVLDELDRMLMELRNSPEGDASGTVEQLQKTLQSNGTLFKVRVLRTQMENKARALQPGRKEARI